MFIFAGCFLNFELRWPCSGLKGLVEVPAQAVQQHSQQRTHLHRSKHRTAAAAELQDERRQQSVGFVLEVVKSTAGKTFADRAVAGRPCATALVAPLDGKDVEENLKKIQKFCHLPSANICQPYQDMVILYHVYEESAKP